MAEADGNATPDSVLSDPTSVAASRPRPQEGWHPIETCPRDTEVFFWLVPKTAEETYTDTDGKPILATCAPYWQRGRWKGWGSLMKPTHWRPLFEAPGAASPPPQEPGRTVSLDVWCKDCGEPFRIIHRYSGCGKCGSQDFSLLPVRAGRSRPPADPDSLK